MTLASLADDWDVVVVGAGPAGTAAAISCARESLNVLLIEAKRFPRRKVCGGCLNQVSTSLLQQLIGTGHALWSSTISFNQFELYHRRRKFAFSMPTGQAVDRLAMDSSLVEVAQAAGVQFISPAIGKLSNVEDDARVVLLEQNGQVARVRCKAVILACGLGNRSAFESAECQLTELQQIPSRSSRIGIEAIFRKFPEEYAAGKLHMAVGCAGYVGLTQIANERLHVAAALERRPLQTLGPASLMQEILREAGAPQLSADETAKWRGTPPLTAQARHFAAERVFLVGDAAGYVEPFTGEGIRWALETGIAVGGFASLAKHKWELALAESWDAWYRSTIGGEQRLCRQIAAGLKRPAMRFLAHQVLRVRPRIASAIITRLNSESPS